MGGSCWYSGSTGATCVGTVGAGVTGAGELAREINAEAAAVSDVFDAFCWSSKSPTIFWSIAVEASVGVETSGGGITSGCGGIAAIDGGGSTGGIGVDSEGAGKARTVGASVETGSGDGVGGLETRAVGAGVETGSGDGVGGLEARAVRAGVGSSSDGPRAVDGSSLELRGEVDSGNILVSKIARKIKTQSPNHLIRGRGDSGGGVCS